MTTVAILERQRMQVAGEDVVCIRGEDAEPDGLTVEMGPVTGAWWEVPLPACPDCGDDLVWWEAGYVPGTRKCLGKPIGEKDGQPTYDNEGGCGSLFSVQTKAVIEAESPAVPLMCECDNGHRWPEPDGDECPICGEYSV